MIGVMLEIFAKFGGQGLDFFRKRMRSFSNKENYQNTE